MATTPSNFAEVIITKTLSVNLPSFIDVRLDDISPLLLATEDYPNPENYAATIKICQVFTDGVIRNFSGPDLYVNVLDDPNDLMTLATNGPGTYRIPEFWQIPSANTIRRLRFFKPSGVNITFEFALQKSDK